METWIDTETLYEGKLITLKKGTVRLDDGQEAIREVVEHNGGVAVVPYIDGSVVLVRQYRVALGKDMLEVPAGKLEGDEEPEHRGRGFGVGVDCNTAGGRWRPGRGPVGLAVALGWARCDALPLFRPEPRARERQRPDRASHGVGSQRSDRCKSEHGATRGRSSPTSQ